MKAIKWLIVWDEQAKEVIWSEKYTSVLDSSNKPFYKWFKGGKLNISHNCIDKNIDFDSIV